MILDTFKLDGKVALVTGSGRGIGQGVAIAMAQAGADLVLVDRVPAAETAEAVAALGRRVAVIERDLLAASPADLAAIVDEAEAALGSVDILVNNAGTIRRTPAAEHSASDWDDVMRLNTDVVFHLSQAAGRRMLARGWGRIINVASMLSFQGGILIPGYTASKHAVAGLTKAFANEWAASGVTVNAVAPGYIATDNTAPLRADAARAESILSRIPIGRWGEPTDLAGAFVFLASPAAAYITGAILPVDGGWLVR